MSAYGYTARMAQKKEAEYNSAAVLCGMIMSKCVKAYVDRHFATQIMPTYGIQLDEDDKLKLSAAITAYLCFQYRGIFPVRVMLDIGTFAIADTLHNAVAGKVSKSEEKEQMEMYCDAFFEYYEALENLPLPYSAATNPLRETAASFFIDYDLKYGSEYGYQIDVAFALELADWHTKIFDLMSKTLEDERKHFPANTDSDETDEKPAPPTPPPVQTAQQVITPGPTVTSPSPQKRKSKRLRILFTVLYIFFAAALTTAFSQTGITLGALPTMLIWAPVFFIAPWRSKEPEQDAQDSGDANNTQKAERKIQPTPEIKATVEKKKPFYKSSAFWCITGGAVCILIVCIALSIGASQTANGTASSARGTPTPTSKQYAFPRNGSTMNLTSKTRLAPFKVTVPDDGHYYYIALVDVETGSKAIIVYVHSGKTVEVDVPLGRYKCYYACGSTWYGVRELFGDEGSYATFGDIFAFHVSGNYYNGHALTLYPVTNGNLDEKRIDYDDFPS